MKQVIAMLGMEIEVVEEIGIFAAEVYYKISVKLFGGSASHPFLEYWSALIFLISHESVM
jgi:hypothetical protein